MIRTKISEKKVEDFIKRGATTPKPKKENREELEVVKNVQLRMPLALLKKIDALRGERKKTRVGVGTSRHDFLLESIFKAVEEGYKDLKRKLI